VIRVTDLGTLAYGGLVTAMNQWDANRMADGRLSDKEVLKKASTWAYLIPGGLATIMSAFGVWRRYENWLEPIQHGFFFGFPQFLTSTIRSMQGTDARSAAVREAQRILNGTASKQLSAGNATGRTYQQEFRKVQAW